MTAIQVVCPSCTASLKLPDRSLVGKKAKCPKCSHRFVITVQEDGPAPQEIPVLPLAPRMGTAARWVPDDEVNATPSTIPFAPKGTADSRSDVGLSGGSSSAGNPLGGVPETPTVFDPAAGSAVERLRTRKRSRSSGWKTSAAMGLLLALFCGGGLLLLNRKSVPPKAPVQENLAWQQEKAEQVASNQSAEALSPTDGERIPLAHIPFTPHILCHLHPAELWRKNRSMGEIQAVLGNFGIWLEGQIKERTRHDPTDIAELTIAINFGARMTPPEVAMVVRLREPHRDLRKRFDGRMQPVPEPEIYQTDTCSVMVINPTTFLVAPLSALEDLPDYYKGEALGSPDMEPLLEKSDRDRHVSLLVDLKILDSHREDAFIEQMQTIADKAIFWHSDQVETVSWSMHFEPDFYMETLLHNASDTTIAKLQRHMQLQMEHLGERMLQVVQRMAPATIGSHQMIGRFPAMLQALNVGTTFHVAPGCVRLVTVLPQHAAANLAAATVLTWNQSLLTNFDEPVKPDEAQSAIPDKLADRLKLKVLIDFRRTPLQEAFAYIGESIKTDVEIDGDALKAAGFTQNMPQTFDLGSVTAVAAIHRILENYEKERDPLVLIVDEAAKKLILSTKTKAEADGLKPYDTRAR